jgi:flagellar hook-associated protein 3 FlgL
MMRISSLAWARNNTTALLEQQARLARTQTEVSTGVRVRTPADDPIAAGRIAGLERALAESRQFERNAMTIENRLGIEETALADATSVLQRVRELVVQGGNATIGAEERRLITAELRSRADELLAVANRTDGAGEYLFTGTTVQTAPFARSAAGVAYYGDATERLVRVSSTQLIADGNSGERVFMSIRAGNGTFMTSAASTNTGTGVVTVGDVVDPTAWIADDYGLSFLTPGSYEIRDGASNLVASGSYTSGAAIEFRGVRLAVSGAPVAGDRFSIAPAERGDVFAIVDRAITALESFSASPADRAKLATAVGSTLAEIDRSIDGLLAVRAGVGARLSALETAGDARAALALDLQSAASELRDVDYAEAVTRLNQQFAGLQAAQAAYTKIGQLSLFDYL